MEFTINEPEKDIVKAVENSVQLANMTDKASMEQLIELVAEWRMYIGMPKNDIAEELVLCATFLKSNYSHLTYEEIKLAIKLSVLRKLKDTEFNGYFSPMYISKVLDSYLYYRKMTLAETIRKRDKYLLEQKEKSNQPTPEERAVRMRDIFRGLYEEYKTKGTFNDPFSLAYNFLRRTQMMKVPQSVIKEAQEFAKKKVEDFKNKEGRINFNFELEEIRWARTYCVQKYFESVEIDILCDNIKPEHFDNLQS